METSYEQRLGFLVPDDGFDPVSEIKRLRRDLMLRLQRLQESAASEAEEASVVRVSAVAASTLIEQVVLSPVEPAKLDIRQPIQLIQPIQSIQPSSETTLYVAPIFRKADEAPRTPETPKLLEAQVYEAPLASSEPVRPTFSTDIVTKEAVVSEIVVTETAVSTNVVSETVVSETLVNTSSAGQRQQDGASESGFIRTLSWINIVLVWIGGVGILAGLYHYILRKQFGDAQGIVLTILVAGVAMVLIGIVGRCLYRHADRSVLAN